MFSSSSFLAAREKVFIQILSFREYLALRISQDGPFLKCLCLTHDITEKAQKVFGFNPDTFFYWKWFLHLSPPPLLASSELKSTRSGCLDVMFQCSVTLQLLETIDSPDQLFQCPLIFEHLSHFLENLAALLDHENDDMEKTSLLQKSPVELQECLNSEIQSLRQIQCQFQSSNIHAGIEDVRSIKNTKNGFQTAVLKVSPSTHASTKYISPCHQMYPEYSQLYVSIFRIITTLLLILSTQKQKIYPPKSVLPYLNTNNLNQLLQPTQHTQSYSPNFQKLKDIEILSQIPDCSISFNDPYQYVAFGGPEETDADQLSAHILGNKSDQNSESISNEFFLSNTQMPYPSECDKLSDNANPNFSEKSTKENFEPAHRSKRHENSQSIQKDIKMDIGINFNKWSHAETDALINGVNTFGKGCWKEIYEKYDVLYSRDLKQLKDKWSQLLRRRLIQSSKSSDTIDR